MSSPDPDDDLRLGKRGILGLIAGLAVLVGLLGLIFWLTRAPSKQAPPTTAPSASPSTSPTPTTAPAPKPGQGVPTTAPKAPPPKIDPGSGNVRTVHVSYPLRVTTANIKQGLSFGKAAADLSKVVLPSTDIVGLNESSPRRVGAIQSWVGGRPGWHYLATDSRSRWQLDDSILYNDHNLSLVRAGNDYGAPASIPPYKINARWIAWAEFKDKRTGSNVTYMQLHFNAGYNQRGHAGHAKAVAENVTYMRNILKLANSFAKDGNVIIGGDWNVDARMDEARRSSALPYSMLSGDGQGPFQTNWQKFGFSLPPTDHTWIDYLAIWLRTASTQPKISFLRQYETTHTFSDHNFVTTDINLSTIRLMGLQKAEKLLQKTHATG